LIVVQTDGRRRVIGFRSSGCAEARLAVEFPFTD